MLSIWYLRLSISQVKRASFYVQLATRGITAIHRSLIKHKGFITKENGANFGELMSLLFSLHTCLRDVDKGKDHEVLISLKGATEFCQELVNACPRALNPTLLQLLRELPVHFSDIGLHEGAILAARQMVTDIHTKLEPIGPSTAECALARSLYVFSTCIASRGSENEGIDVTKECVQLCGRLLQGQPAATASDLLGLLDKLFTSLRMGENDFAINTLQRFITVLRKAVATLPEHKPSLARSLRILSVHLSEADMRDDAFLVDKEAADIYRGLSEDGSSRKDLAVTLRDLSESTQCNHLEAIAFLQESVRIFRGEGSFGIDLLISLEILSKKYRVAGMQDGALSATKDMVRICRGLKRKNISGSNLALAKALHSLFHLLSDQGRSREALTAIREAVGLISDAGLHKSAYKRATFDSIEGYVRSTSWRKTAIRSEEEEEEETQENPHTYSLELAQALRGAIDYYKVEGRWSDALCVLREAASRYPVEYASELDQSLHDAFNFYKVNGDWYKALPVIREAARRCPDKYNSELGEALNDAFNSYKAECNWSRALVVIREAANRKPDRYNVELGEALRDAFDYYKDKCFWQEAIIVMVEAVTINPAKYGLELDQALRDALNYFKAKCFWREAIAVMGEAAAVNPVKYDSELDQTLRDAFDYFKAKCFWREAIDIMGEAVAVNPVKYGSELDQALRDAFDYYKAEGFQEEALTVMREAASRNPDKYNLELDKTQREVFDSYQADGFLEEALVVMQEAASRDPDKYTLELEQALRDVYHYAKDAGLVGEALTAVQELADMDLEKYSLELNQALSDAFDYYRTERLWKEAFTVVREAVSTSSDECSLEALRLVFKYYEANGLWDEALKLTRILVVEATRDNALPVKLAGKCNLEPDTDECSLVLGTALCDAFEYFKDENEWNNAIPVMREAVRRNTFKYNSELDQMVHAASDHYKEKGEWDNALLVIREAAFISPEKYSQEMDQTLRDAFDYYYNAKGLWNMDAAKILQEAANRDPENYSLALGHTVHDAFNFYKSRCLWDEALFIIREAASKDLDECSSELDEALFDAFNYYRTNGDLDKALLVIREAASRNPNGYILELDQAVCDAFDHHKANGNWDEALAIMREAASRNPDRYNLELCEALCDTALYYQHKLKRPIEAIIFLREAARRNALKYDSKLKQAIALCDASYQSKAREDEAVSENSIGLNLELDQAARPLATTTDSRAPIVLKETSERGTKVFGRTLRMLLRGDRVAQQGGNRGITYFPYLWEDDENYRKSSRGRHGRPEKKGRARRSGPHLRPRINFQTGRYNHSRTRR